MENIGNVVWFDLAVTDFNKAKIFYSELFGWKFEPMGDSYLMITAGKEMIGGLRKAKTVRASTDAPVLYIGVDKLDSALERAKRLGGTLMGEKVKTGDEGVYHLFKDADHNVVGIWAKS